MSRRTAGEELQLLFRQRDGNTLSAEDFARRKARILLRSGCRLTVPLPGVATRCLRAVRAAIVEPLATLVAIVRLRRSLK